MKHLTAKASIQVKDRRRERVVQPVLIERRSKVRFPLELPLRYRTLERRHPSPGQGCVINMSSGGVLVTAQHEMRVGIVVELSIDWPFLLDGRVPLQLVASGKVARCDSASFVLLLSRHLFRTAKKTILPIVASHVGARSQNSKGAAAGVCI